MKRPIPIGDDDSPLHVDRDSAVMCIFDEAVRVIDMHVLDPVRAPLHFGGAACLFVKHTSVP